MTDFLIRIFIGKNGNPNDPALRAKYATLAGVTGIILNVLLFIGKLVMGILSLSVAIIADAFNNISDAGSSIVTLLGVRLSNKPVDKAHPLGHGRYEYICGFIVDMLIILVGFELFKSSIEKIIDPVNPSVGNATFIILAASILVKIWLFVFYRKIGNRIHSSPVKAASADSLTDCIATTLVLASATIARIWGISIDGWAGILVAAFILFTGLKAAKETIDLLLGSTPDPAFVQSIYAFVKDYQGVVGIHDVMVHDYGPGRQIVSFHAEVPSDCDINLAHEEIDRMERDMHAQFGCIVTVHLDPIVVGDPLVDELRTLAEREAKGVHAELSIHDFRMTKGETQINLIFDLVLPVDCPLCSKDAERQVSERIKAVRPDCACVIKVEHPFV